MEKQKEKAAEIAAALFEEAARYSPPSESTNESFHNDIKNKWRSAEDIYHPKYKKSKSKVIQGKDNVWKTKPNHSKKEEMNTNEKQDIKCSNVYKGNTHFIPKCKNNNNNNSI